MSNKKNGENILMIIGVIYFIISQIMTCYFWWLWIKDHGFWSSILIGPIVGEFKGIFWIFFI
jgi:hypothetical protein